MEKLVPTNTTFNFYGDVSNSIVAQNIQASAIAVEASSANSELKELLGELNRQIVMAMSSRDAAARDPESDELASENLAIFASEAIKPANTRKVARLRQYAANLAGWAQSLGQVAAPILELISQIQHLAS